MPKGRNPKPDNVKLLQGTLRKHRQKGSSPAASTGTPVAPDFFSDTQKQYFNTIVYRLESRGGASETYTEAICNLAIALAEVEFCCRKLERGMTYKTENSTGSIIWKPRPEVGMLVNARRDVNKFLCELGLTLASVSKAPVTSGAEKKKSRFDFGNG